MLEHEWECDVLGFEAWLKDAVDGYRFMSDLAGRLKNRVQLTTDGHAVLISTSYVERQNLTMRMGMRRFTRLTNAFSKKVENLAAAVSLHFFHYNFARPHRSLANPYPRTPAMTAGIADHIWALDEIAGLLEPTVGRT
jgi:hypothetical protein